MNSKIVVAIVIIAVIFIAKATYGMFGKYKESLSRREISEQQLAELEKRAERLAKEIDRLNTPQGVEEEIRLQFNVAKEGEEVAIIIDKEQEKKLETVKDRGVWDYILGLFGVN